MVEEVTVYENELLKGEAPSTWDEASRKETDMTETERQETMTSPSSITPDHQKTIEPIDAVREEIQAAGKRALDTEWQIREQLRFYGYKEGDRVVIEALPPKFGENRGTFYAWSDDVATLVDLARNVKVPHQGVYIHADPIFPDATAKFGPNEWVKQGGGAGFVTKDVASIRVLKIDVDPVRKNNTKDVSATKGETDEAKSVARSIYNDLAPVVGTNAIAYLFSGNGVQLHIALDDLANDESNIEKTKRILQSLNVLYSSEGKAEIDTTLVDPRRVVPLAGTMKRKGHNDIALKRPHRPVWIYVPEQVERLDQDQFDALVVYLDERLDDEQKRRVEDALRNGKPGVPAPAPKASKSEGKKSKWKELLDRANEVPIREVASRLGFDEKKPSCPACGAGGNGSDVAYLDGKGANVIKCLHATCGARVFNPVSLVAKVAFQVDDLRGNKEACRNVLKWFADNFGLEAPKSGKRASLSSAASGMDLNDDDDVDAIQAAIGGGAGEEEATLPEIHLGNDIHRVLDEAIAALSRDADLFARGGALVRIGEGDDGAPAIKRVSARLMEVRYLSRCATWWKYDARKKDMVQVTPPEKIAQAVCDAEEYPGHRKLVGIAVSPVMRADGTILDAPGYDAASELFYAPNAEYGTLPTTLSRADADKALGELLEVVCDMPLSDEHKAAWLAWLLSYFVRPMFRGPSPMFVLDANSPGAAKTLLTRVTSIIATGREPSQIQYTSSQDEIEKRITAMLLDGPPFAYFDNIDDGGSFGGPKLEALTTSDVWGSRLLGKSEQLTVPNRTIWSVTGNNLVIKGAMLRRVIHIRFETLHERPEDRDDFRHPNLIGWVHENRERLVRACLTIVRAWVCAGRPRAGVTLGSFEGWCSTVGEMVYWITGVDVTLTRKALAEREGSSDRHALARLVDAWLEHVNDRAISTKDLLKLLSDEDRRVAAAIRKAEKAGEELDGDEFVHKYQSLRDAITDFAPTRGGKLPSVVHLGRHLGANRATVVNGYRFVQSKDSHLKTTLWRLEAVSNPMVKNAEKMRGVDPSSARIANENTGNSHLRKMGEDEGKIIFSTDLQEKHWENAFAEDGEDKIPSLREILQTDHSPPTHDRSKSLIKMTESSSPSSASDLSTRNHYTKVAEDASSAHLLPSSATDVTEDDLDVFFADVGL